MRPLQWIAAGCFSLAVHLALAGLYLGQARPAPALPLPGDGEGIEVGLVADSGPATAGAAAPSPEPEPPTPQPDSAPEPQPAPEPEPQPAPQPEPAPQPVPEPPAQAPLETVAAPLQPDTAVAVAEATPPPRPQARAARVASAPPPASDSRGAPGSATSSAPRRGRPGDADAARHYLGKLMGWLGRHKHYPAELKRKKQQGIVTVKFTIARDGALLASSIAKTSGNPRLDEAALAMLANATPMPAIPDSLDRDSLTLVIPVEYSLITNSPIKE